MYVINEVKILNECMNGKENESRGCGGEKVRRAGEGKTGYWVIIREVFKLIMETAGLETIFVSKS